MVNVILQVLACLTLY